MKQKDSPSARCPARPNLRFSPPSHAFPASYDLSDNIECGFGPLAADAVAQFVSKWWCRGLNRRWRAQETRARLESSQRMSHTSLLSGKHVAHTVSRVPDELDRYSQCPQPAATLASILNGSSRNFPDIVYGIQSIVVQGPKHGR